MLPTKSLLKLRSLAQMHRVFIHAFKVLVLLSLFFQVVVHKAVATVIRTNRTRHKHEHPDYTKTNKRKQCWCRYFLCKKYFPYLMEPPECPGELMIVNYYYY